MANDAVKYSKTFGKKIAKSKRFVLWLKGARTASDFYNDGYLGSWLLADGSMITGKPLSGAEHRTIYGKFREELRKSNAVRVSDPGNIEVYWPVSQEQREEIARLYNGYKRILENKNSNCPVELWWDLNATYKRKNYYGGEAASMNGNGTLGDFLRALDEYEIRYKAKTIKEVQED